MNTELEQEHQENALITAENIYEAEQLNKWIFDTIKPWLKGKIIDVGSGKGSVPSYFIDTNIRLRLSDPHSRYCHFLQKKFEGQNVIKGIHKIIPEHEKFEKVYAGILGKFDTVLSLNIMEHNSLNKQGLINIKRLLKERGRLILIQRVSTALYNDSDLAFEKWRSENRLSIRRLLGADMEILKTKYLQVVGNIGWYLDELTKNEESAPQTSRVFFKAKVAFFRVSDEILSHRIGLSMIVISRKIEQNL